MVPPHALCLMMVSCNKIQQNLVLLSRQQVPFTLGFQEGFILVVGLWQFSKAFSGKFLSTRIASRLHPEVFRVLRLALHPRLGDPFEQACRGISDPCCACIATISAIQFRATIVIPLYGYNAGIRECLT